MLMRFLIEGVLPISWVVYTVWVSVSRWGYKRHAEELEERITGLHEPELWLPEKERQALARHRLQREEEQENEEHYEDLLKRQTNPLRHIEGHDEK